MLISGKPHKKSVCADPLRTPAQEREMLRDLARKAEQELTGVQMASMDELTLLSNRHGFLALAQMGLDACAQLERPATLLFFNLDDFKRINYLFGHAEGDDALKTFADVLRIGFRENDVIGRLEGATFVALLTGSGSVDPAAIKARLPPPGSRSCSTRSTACWRRGRPRDSGCSRSRGTGRSRRAASAGRWGRPGAGRGRR